MPTKTVTTTTFRIFRRSDNRQSFGHRNYFLMDRNGLAFTAQRVYDLPLNGEFVAKQDPDTKQWNWAELGFEVPSPLTPPPPQKVIDLVFKPDAVKADLNACVME